MLEEVIIKEELEEESSILPKSIVSAKSYDWVEDETLAILIKKPISALDVCGKSLIDWVALACGKMQKVIIDEVNEEDLLQALKPYAETKKYLLVLFGDTPLLEKSTVAQALDYFASKNLSAMVLPRGYVFSCDYIKTTDVIFSPVRKSFAPEQFLQVSSPKEISDAFEVLSQRIRDYHKANGVVLMGEKSIFIDADVEIEAGVIIEPMNVLKGSTIIEENCFLKSGNIIVDTLVQKGTTLCAEHLVMGKRL